MRGLLPVLFMAVLSVAIMSQSLHLYAGSESNAAMDQAAEAASESRDIQTVPVNESVERQGLIVHVLDLVRSNDPQDQTITLNIVLENRTEQDWSVVPQNFSVQDRSHVYTYPAQFPRASDQPGLLNATVLHPGDSQSGALLFRAPVDGGLDLAFGLISGTRPSYVTLIP